MVVTALKRAGTWGVVVLPLLALLLRLAYAATLPPRIVVTYEADPITYDQIARNLMAGRGFSGASFYYPAGSDVPTAFWDALYPVFLATIYWLGGPNIPLVRAVQALLGAVAVGLTYWLGSRLIGRRAGLLAAAISAVYPFFIYYSAQLLTETLFMALILGAIVVALKAEEIARARWFALLGGVIGLAALCRAEAFLFGLALVPWTAWRAIRSGAFVPAGPTRSQRVALAATALLAMALVLSPWVVRNQITFGAPIFTTTKLGYNLFKYYHPTMTADQTVRTVPFPPMEGLGEPQREALMRAEALRFMASDPGRTLWFMLNKLVLLFKLTPTNDVNRQYALVSIASYGALLPFMAAGFVITARRILRDRDLRFLPLVAYVLFSVATKAAVFAGIRLRMQIEPFLILLAALAITRVAGHSLARLLPRILPRMAPHLTRWLSPGPALTPPRSRPLL